MTFLAGVILGCGASRAQSAAGDAGGCFVATQGDFAGFQDWPSFDGGTNAADGLGVSGAQRTIYINRAPPHGSTAFPVGTILVKTTEGTVTFGMAKRGCGFNPTVSDWEWFQLTPGPNGAPLIGWRGTDAPVGSMYSSNSPSSCNECHTAFTANDSVGGDALQLSQF